jgi:hypothetical protein
MHFLSQLKLQQAHRSDNELPKSILEYPTAPAHKNDGAITYHFGKAILKDVAVAKAVDVCPDGKDGLPPEVSFSIYG